MNVRLMKKDDNMNVKSYSLDDSMEDDLLSLTLKDVFDFLHKNTIKKGKPTAIGVQYLDVFFEIGCREVPEKIVPRGYENE